jgi:hypothetical protein
MKHPLRCVAIFAFALLFTHLGNSCAYEGPEVIFIQHSDPDAPYASYLAGRLGIIQPDYRIRHLVVAYNYLSGHPLTPAEQQAAAAVDKFYNTYPGDTGIFMGSDSATWTDGAKVSVDRRVPGSQYEYFTNCLPDTFAKADATLADIRAHYGKPGAPDTPDIQNWIEGQNAVFSNCNDTGQMPQPVTATAPLWLRQDRAYQLAAAQFYALDYDAALAGFRAIAADSASPWSMLAHYLVARVYIRQALVPDLPQATPQQSRAPAIAKARASLLEARDQLQSILRDPAMQPIHEQSQHLLDYVMLRLDPDAQSNVLAKRLTAPAGDPNYRQDVIDLTFAYNSSSSPYASTSPITGKTAPVSSENDQPLIRWLADLGSNAQPPDYEDAPSVSPPQNPADALAMWQQTHAPQWLVAALTTAQPGAAENAKLIAAAREIPPSSPAYASATYQRLRLAAKPPAPVEHIPASTAPVYAELSHLMPSVAQSQPISTINQFADLRVSLSPTFNDFLAGATFRSVSSSGVPIYSNTDVSGPNKPVTLCGVPLYDSDTRHLDDQTALIFNQRLPLRVLEQAALSPTLPANVRFEVAHMAWTRALLLDRPDVARALSPYLAGCQPAFAQWLNQYNAARTPSERHVLGLLALMRFTSTEPLVRSGFERDFAAYDIMRDNWWCSSAAAEGQDTGPSQNLRPSLFAQTITPRIQQPDPPFITAADRAQADKEIAQLEKIPCASDYFASQALAWVKAHPDDPRDADLIGFAMRAVRNACRSSDTPQLNHRLFDVIHRQFPNSEWARRYKTWE